MSDLLYVAPDYWLRVLKPGAVELPSGGTLDVTSQLLDSFVQNFDGPIPIIGGPDELALGWAIAVERRPDGLWVQFEFVDNGPGRPASSSLATAFTLEEQPRLLHLTAMWATQPVSASY